jgi:hypothetical protein
MRRLGMSEVEVWMFGASSAESSCEYESHLQATTLSYSFHIGKSVKGRLDISTAE